MPPKTDLQISIIILNWNTPIDTAECVASILGHTSHDSYEIIVIDSGSAAGERDTMRERAESFPDIVRTVYLPDNIGFAAGCNYGASIARGDYFEFLNSDTTVGRNWLQAKLKIFNKYVHVGGVTSRIYENDCFVYSGRHQHLKTLHGASMMISRSAWKRVGSFDAGNFSPFCSEELDWSYRARKMGFKLLLSPKSIVFHHGSVSIDKYANSNQTLYIRLRNRMRFRLFNYGITDWLYKAEQKQFAREFYHAIRDGYLFLLVKAWMTNIYDIRHVLSERQIRRERRNQFRIG